MKKYLKEKPKPKKTNKQNKLKKVLYPANAKPITLETNTGTNNQKLQKKRLNKQPQKQKQKNVPVSPSSRRVPNDKNGHPTNKSQNNNSLLELDYLNFSKIDLGFCKINSSFDDDIFSSKIFKQERKQIVSNRYNEIDSSIDTIKTETNNNNNIEESKENLLKTPSTLCNYYDKSEAASSTKKAGDEKENFMNSKNELRKNLDKLYENSKNNDLKYINVNTKQQNVVNWRLKDSIKITKNKSSNVSVKDKDKENKENKEKNFSKTLNNNSNNDNNNINKEINKIIFEIKQNNNSKSKQQIQKNENIMNNNEKIYRNNLMENYLNSKIKKRKNSFNMSSSKKNNYYNKMSSIPKENIAKTLKYTNNSSTKSIHIQNNTTGITGNMNIKNNLTNNTNTTKNINSLINANYNKTITGILMNTNNSNLSNTGLNIENKKTNNTTNGIYYNNMQNTNNYKKGKHSTQQKPIILCYDQMKYDSYFVTPKNTSKITKGKVQSSNKSTKIDSNSGGNGNGNNTNIKNNNSTVKNNNYNILVNTLSKAKNKSFNKNKINNDMVYKNYNSTNNNNKLNKNNNYINDKKYEKAKMNLKNNNKSSSSLIKQKGITVNKNVEYSNTNINSLLKILHSGGKENSQLLNLLKKMNNSNTKSPLKKYKSSNALKISKTLTEQNILNRMQVTPKYYKIPKSGNAYTTTLPKKNIYINSNEKIGTDKAKNIKFNNSSIKKNYQFLRSNNNYNEILGNFFNHKTQSDFKTNKYYILNNSNMNSNNNAKSNNNKNKYMINNNEYGMDKHVKQKLLDRMNNATNNGWQYILRGNNPNNHNNGNKKILMENLSEIMKSPDKNDFINNNTIISNESEDEKENKENNEKII
jgi:hypothetical protein